MTLAGAIRLRAADPEPTPDANALYTAAIGAYDRGDFQAAATSISAVLAQIPRDLPPADQEKLAVRLEPIYFTLGAAYYNLKDWSKASAAFEDYVSRYPKGAFVTDAKYRRAQCLFVTQKNDEAVSACQDWLRQYTPNPQRGEVLSLLGDAQAAGDHPDEALDAYTQSYKAAANDEALGYTITAAAKILQKRGDWPAIDAIFEAFVREHPDHPMVATAMSWIARADIKQGKFDEAKQFLAVSTKRFIADRRRDDVETLLDQLAALCASRKPSTDASAAPGEELDALLGDAEKDPNPTVQARVLYAQAQLARFRGHEAEAARDLLAIGAKFHPADLSAALLGQVGDALLAAGKPDEAAPFFHDLLDGFPKSDVADYGDNGLGEIALRKKNYGEALRCFDGGLDRGEATAKLKELTLGKASALLGLGRYADAKKLFEQVASSKEWRGEATAASVFSLGEIEARQGRWAEANAYYQRVYVAYQRFPPWVAKAYLGSAASLEKLGKRQDAINTYRDMLRNRKLSDLPETAEARRRLQALGAG